MVTCPLCGASEQSAGAYCTGCGMQVPRPAPARPAPQTQPKVARSPDPPVQRAQSTPRKLPPPTSPRPAAQESSSDSNSVKPAPHGTSTGEPGERLRMTGQRIQATGGIMAAGGCMITLVIFVLIPLVVLVIALLVVEPSMGIGALLALVLAAWLFWAIFKRT